MTSSSFTLEIAINAEKDLYKICAWYEERQDGLSTVFRLNFSASLSKLRANSFAYSIIRKNSQYRRYHIRRFPYRIYYIVESKKIIILAIIHISRSNRYIKRRLR